MAHLVFFSLQGMIEAGSKKPVTFTWTPPQGFDVSILANAVVLSLQTDFILFIHTLNSLADVQSAILYNMNNLNSLTSDYYAERQCRARSLSRAPMDGQCWVSNPRPFKSM